MGKPGDNTGLWASRIDSLYGWKEWCEENDFNLHKLRKSFSFCLAEDANTLLISHPKELESLPLTKPYHYVEKNWDLGEHPTAEQIKEVFTEEAKRELLFQAYYERAGWKVEESDYKEATGQDDNKDSIEKLGKGYIARYVMLERTLNELKDKISIVEEETTDK